MTEARTHTIRNKSGPTPIVTFTSKFFAELKEADPDAIALTLDWFSRRYRSLTGKSFRLDPAQETELWGRFDLEGKGTWASRFSEVGVREYQVLTVFQDGFLARDCGWGLREAFDIASRFYKLANGLFNNPQVQEIQERRKTVECVYVGRCNSGRCPKHGRMGQDIDALLSILGGT